MRKLTTYEFIEKSKKIHGNTYDYSFVNYKVTGIKVTITCKKHGNFTQLPRDHMRRHGCRECANEINPNIRFTLEEFIDKSIILHNNMYSYSKITEYKNARTKVCIICPEHGEFWQTPNMHLQGQGCMMCGGKKQHTTESFIKISVEEHGYKYDYSKVVYKNNSTQVVIICPKHGEFKQMAKKHMEGSNCPRCFESKGEKLIAKILDDNTIQYTSQKTFNDCRSIKQNRKFPFDFYLPKYNLIIEYDGEQHFEPIIFRGTTKKQANKNFKQVQINDATKNEYCLKNNVNLLRIPYTNIADVEKIILEKISLITEYSTSSSQ